jgi:hypothetical protein
MQDCPDIVTWRSEKEEKRMICKTPDKVYTNCVGSFS